MRNFLIIFLIYFLPIFVSAGEFETVETIDNFDYPNRDSAISEWRAISGTPNVDVVPIMRGGNGLKISAPFSEIDRTIHDRNVKLDLTEFGSFQIDLFIADPVAFRAFTLYFRSGGGWFSCYARISEIGWQKLTFNKIDFGVEGKPIGWHAIDGVRLSAWKAKPIDCEFVVDRLVALCHQITMILPTEKSGMTAVEMRSAKQSSEVIHNMLIELGLPSDLINDEIATPKMLANRKLVILPLNSKIPKKLSETLKSFVDRGGKIFAIYGLPSEIAELLHFRKTGWIREDRPNNFSKIWFHDREILGLPPKVDQASWNITIAEPIDESSRVVGFWRDGDGKSTDHPALLINSNGAFFSHLILTDDPIGKMKMLSAIIGHLVPSIWEQIADHALDDFMRVGHLTQIDEIDKFIKNSGDRQAKRLLNKAKQLRKKAIGNYDQKRFIEAVQLINDSRFRLSEAYLLSHESPQIETRAVWNHSGTGAFPGDWERSIRELANAGFNAIFPNMLWAGLAHYDSEILPQSWTFRQFGDQVDQCVSAAKKHGVEVHVWKVNWNLINADDDFVAKMRSEDRLQRDRNGEEIRWLCPSNPANLKLEIESMLEVAEKYEIDGLHFDYIRYPNSNGCYCDGCRDRFEKGIGLKVAEWPEDVLKSGGLRDRFVKWRADQITTLVRIVSEKAKLIRPKIKISAAVFNSYPSCIESIGQDWVSWAKAGYVDFLCPMNYTPNNDRFDQLVKNHRDLVPKNVSIYPGIGATATPFGMPIDQIVGQIFLARRAKNQGFVIFDYSPKTAKTVISKLGLSEISKK